MCRAAGARPLDGDLQSTATEQDGRMNASTKKFLGLAIVATFALAIAVWSIFQSAINGSLTSTSPLESPLGSTPLPTVEPTLLATVQVFVSSDGQIAMPIPFPLNFTTTFTSPNATVVLPAACSYSDVPHCYGQFPNGATMELSGIRWSFVERFAVVCSGGTHDSPCKGYEIWNIAEGQYLETLPWSTWGRWEPSGHIFAYTTELSANKPTLFLFDAKTGRQSSAKVCPEWLSVYKTDMTDLEWSRLCGHTSQSTTTSSYKNAAQHGVQPVTAQFGRTAAEPGQHR